MHDTNFSSLIHCCIENEEESNVSVGRSEIVYDTAKSLLDHRCSYCPGQGGAQLLSQALCRRDEY